MAGYMATSKTCEWGTPRDLFIELDEEFSFDLDPASSHSNAKCERHYTVEEDGLAQPWDGSVFVNPPYGAVIAQWIDKAIQESHRCTRIVMLLPARTDTRWFHRLLDIGAEVRFVRGRLKFESEGGGGDGGSGHVPQYHRRSVPTDRRRTTSHSGRMASWREC
jgi:site-specific DNA-methyltransferase (adenine-specific)